MKEKKILVVDFDTFINSSVDRIVITNIPTVQEQIHSKMFNVPMLYESELEQLTKNLIHMHEPEITKTEPITTPNTETQPKIEETKS